MSIPSTVSCSPARRALLLAASRHISTRRPAVMAHARAAAEAATPELLRTVWQVGGAPTEILQLPTTSSRPVVELLVVPGNPGAAPFYTPFMHALHRQLGGRASVTAVSNLGMDGQGLTPRGRVFSLEEQIAHKEALLREHYAGPGRPPVVVLAHSIGTYIAIHALARLEGQAASGSRATAAALDEVAGREWEHPDAAGASLEAMQAELEATREQQQGQQQSGDEQQGGEQQGGEQRGRQQVERQQQGQQGAAEGGSSRGNTGQHPGIAVSNVVKIVGLYPFLQVDPECSSQGRLRRITPYHGALSTLAGGLGWLPLALRRRLVQALSKNELDAHAVDVAATVFGDACCVQNGLYMGWTEFETLAAPADWWLVQSLGHRIAMFAAPGDVWFKRWKWDAMHREVPGIEAHWVEAQSHAFCVSVRQSEELAARVVPIVEAALITSKL